MSTTPAAFTGSSSFSSSLAQTVARSVSFAALPMQQLQGEETTVTGQQAEVATLTTDFASLQTALDSINSAAGSNANAVNVDTPAVASATVSSGAAAGTYSVVVSNVGSHTNTLSSRGATIITDPTTSSIDGSASYTLTVGSNPSITVSNAAGTLSGLAAAINASGASVQATVVNIGSTSAPDYRLSVQGTKYSSDAIQLNSGATSLLNQLSAGAPVQYQVNGSGSTVSSDTRTLSLSTGLSVNLLATGTVNMTVSQSTAGISNALSSLVSAYNKASADLTKSRGQNGGALAGQSVIYQLSSALQSIASYTGTSGKIGSLSDVGLTFSSSGELQFDSAAFQQATTASPTDLISYFGTESGSGFLQNTGNLLKSVTDPTSGILPGFSDGLTTNLSHLTTKVAADQLQITALQTRLTNQMSSADAAIASMEQQLSYITSMFNAQTANEIASGG